MHDTSGKFITVLVDDSIEASELRFFDALARNHGDKVMHRCVHVVSLKEALSQVEIHRSDPNDHSDGASGLVRHENGSRSVGMFGYWNSIECAVSWCGVDRDTATRAADTIVAAKAFDADIIATEDPVLLRVFGDYNTLLPTDALAVIGLYVRKRDAVIVTSKDGLELHESRWGAHTMALDQVIPVLFLLQQGSLGKQDEGDLQTPAYRLALSVRTRLYRMMLARDLVHEPYHRNPSMGGAEDAAFALDTLMLNLVGAFDALARLADDVYALGLDRGECGWQRREFRRALREHGAVELADAASSQKFQDTFALLRQLRNSIHGEALDTFSIENGDRKHDRYPVTLLGQDGLDLMECVERVAAPEDWGITEWSARDGVHLQADTFAERAVDAAVTDLRTLTDAFDLERLHNSENALRLAAFPLRGFGSLLGQDGVDELVSFAGIGGATSTRRRPHN